MLNATETSAPSAASLLVAIAQQIRDGEAADLFIEQAEALGLDESRADAFANAVAGDLDRTIAALR